MSKLNGATRGAIAGGALAVSLLTGGLWLSDEPAASTQAYQCDSSHTVFAGRAGALPSCPATHQDRVIRKVVGTTVTGCVLGLASGGPEGAAYGCLGGLAGNIPF